MYIYKHKNHYYNIKSHQTIKTKPKPFTPLPQQQSFQIFQPEK